MTPPWVSANQLSSAGTERSYGILPDTCTKYRYEPIIMLALNHKTQYHFHILSYQSKPHVTSPGVSANQSSSAGTERSHRLLLDNITEHNFD